MDLKRRLPILVLLTVVCFGIPCALGQTETSIDALYKKAKQEGEVTVWGPQNPIPPIITVFKKRFPGIRVNHFETQGTEAVQRIVAEAQAGQTNADVTHVSIKEGLTLIDRKLISRYEWVKMFGSIGITRDHLLLDGFALSFFHLETPLMVNTSLVTKDVMPRSWEDVLHPRWQGKILLEQRAREWGYLAILWNDQRLREFMGKLKQQKPRFLRGGLTVVQQLAAGDGALGSGGYGYYTLNLQKKGAPVDIAPVSPVGCGTRGLTVLKNAKHPAAAQLFVAVASSPEGQNELEAATGQGSLAPGSTLKLAKAYSDRGLKLVFEERENIDRVERGIEIVQEALGIP